MVTNLDKPVRLMELDEGGMLKNLGRFPEDCRLAVETAEGVCLGELGKRAFKSVVFAGVGGSAIGGKLITDWLSGESGVPMVVSVGYSLPGFVDREALVLSVSYSGNTEETLSMFREALDTGAQIASFTSGGQLERLSKERGIPLVSMPGGLKPRAALPFQFFMLATVLERLGLVPCSGEVDEAIEVLGEVRDGLVPEVPSASNPAKRLALDLFNKVPFVYGSELFGSVAYRFGTQLNENSKVPAGSGSFPELFHNVVLACEAPKEVLDPLCLLFIRDPLESDTMSRKIDRFKALFEPRVGRVLEAWARGRGKLARMFSILLLGDYVSTYLALLYGHDPSSMDAIDELKRVR
jgi:glucose/mannose-6-phosphate isomerase